MIAQRGDFKQLPKPNPIVENYLSLLLFTLLSWNLSAQCPPGDVTLTTQEEVNTFVATYPNCTEIIGSLTIGNPGSTSDVTDLTGLDALTSVGGSLDIEQNNALISLTGLDALTSLGGFLWIRYNASLTTLTGLDVLTSLDGTLRITGNASLTSLTGLENIDASGITDLFILNNAQLSTCAVESICAYLDVAMNSATIYGNATNCASRAEVETAYTAVNVTEISQTNIEVFPNPTTGRLQWSEVSPERVEVFTMQGQRVMAFANPGQELDVSTLPAGVYVIHMVTADQVYASRVVKQ